VSIGFTVVLGVALAALAGGLPLSGNAEHAGLHLAGAVPALVLLLLAARTWPATTTRAATISRRLLLAGLAVIGLALVTEALGAFGYSESNDYEPVNGLATLHDVAVPLSPVGVVLVMTGTILSIGVHVATRRGAAQARYLTVVVVLAVAAAVAFVAGGLILGY
jgi:hypothetical protein